MGSQTLTNLLATYVDESNPVKNYDAGASIYVKDISTRIGLAYLWFQSPFPLGATITSAKLHLYSYAKATAGSITMYLKMLNQTVSYGKVTYNTRPTQLLALAESTVTKPGTYPDREEFVFDITTHMQAVSGGTKWFGYQLRTNWTNAAYSPRFMSPQHPNPDLRPWVEITWSDAPSAPTSLSPSGQRIVSNDQPTLGFNYIDVSGDTDIAGVQVQINTTASFTTPAYDSGEQPVDAPQWELEGSTFTAAPATTYYWRVRVQDGAGLWSGWSATASFQYAVLPTFEIQNPPLPPNNFVEEPTPPITWNVLTGTQASYSVDIYVRNASNTAWVSVWKRGRTVSAIADGLVVPAGVITQKNGTYLVDIRVWDDLAREAVPNGQVYALMSRQFTYQFSALTSPVTNLEAFPGDPLPGIVLEWDRATAPDSYSVIRDGVVIASNLDPDNDTWVDGIHNAWMDRTPTKKKAHTYSVQAIVNGKASDSNPEVTATNVILGTWLLDANESTSVCLVQDKTRTFEYDEESAVYYPMGSDHSVVVTQSMGGYHGTVNGELRSENWEGAPNVEAWLANMLKLKGVPGQIMYLFITGMTIPVVIRKAEVYPLTNAERVWAVSFEYYQQGDLNYLPKL